MHSTTSLVGNLTADPDARCTQDRHAVASFRVAVSRRWQNRDTPEWEEPISFIDVVCWRELAEHVALSLQKGTGPLFSGLNPIIDM